MTCLWGDWCAPHGEEYIHRLYRGVESNLSAPFRFWCLTDRERKLSGTITQVPMKAEWPGNLPKIEMFAPHMPFEGRVLAMDPDNIVMGSLDDIAKYDGKFATLWDWYEKGSGGNISGFEAGAQTHLYNEMRGNAKAISLLARGSERMFLRMYLKNPDYWQDLYPGQFQSFKVGCDPTPPEGTRMVCFHGAPRPHECRSPWVEKHWGPPIDGTRIVPFPRNAVKRHELLANMAVNVDSGVRRFMMPEGPKKEGLCIVGGGPTLKGQLPKLRKLARKNKILAVNGAGKYLRSKGVKPWGVLIVDPRPDNIAFVRPQIPGVEYFLSSTCHPDVVKAVDNPTLVHFHVCDGQRELLDQRRMGDVMIGGGSAVGHRAFYFGIIKGHTVFHMFGVDCCISEVDDKLQHHAYPQNLRPVGLEQVVDVHAYGRTFLATGWMFAQAQEFKEALKMFQGKYTVKVYGDSLLKAVVENHSKEQAA